MSSTKTLAQIPTNLLPQASAAAPFASLDRHGVDKVNECYRDKKDCEAALKKANGTDWVGDALKIGGGIALGLLIGKVVFSSN